MNLKFKLLVLKIFMFAGTIPAYSCDNFFVKSAYSAAVYDQQIPNQMGNHRVPKIQTLKQVYGTKNTTSRSNVFYSVKLSSGQEYRCESVSFVFLDYSGTNSRPICPESKRKIALCAGDLENYSYIYMAGKHEQNVIRGPKVIPFHEITDIKTRSVNGDDMEIVEIKEDIQWLKETLMEILQRKADKDGGGEV